MSAVTDLVASIAYDLWVTWDDRPASRPMIRTSAQPMTETGERVYAAARGIVLGYRLLERVERFYRQGHWYTELYLGSPSVAVTPFCTIPSGCRCVYRWSGPHPRRIEVRGFEYRSWDRLDEWRFPGWRSARPYTER